MKKILIIEDSALIAKILTKKFKAKGFSPVTLTSYSEAQALLRSGETFFAATLDLNLPDAPNGEIVDLVLSYDIPAIVLSGSYDSTIYETMVNKNIIDYVIKNHEEDFDYVVKLIEKIAFYSSLTALVVDDSTVYRSLIVSYLTNLRFNVLQACDGKEALDVLKNSPEVTLILTDYNMPRMDGFELILELRKKHTKNDLVVLAVTTNDTYEVTSKFLKYGANGYISKPFTKEAFNYSVNNAMELYQTLQHNATLTQALDNNIFYSTTDTQGRIVTFSKAFQKFTGFSEEELIGKKHNKFRSTETPDSLYEEMWQTITIGKKWCGLLKNHCKDRREYWAEVEIEPMKDNKGEIIGYASIHYDVTDKVLRQEEQAMILHESRFSTIGHTIGTIAHHWRQPLGIISLLITNVYDELSFDEKSIDDPDIQEQFSTIMRTSQTLSCTIDNFRRFFEQSYESSFINLEEIVRETLDFNAAILNDPRIEVIIDIPPTLSCKTYSNELKQLLLILITNAKEALIRAFNAQTIQDGVIKIHATPTDKEIFIALSDNAGGIANDLIDKIFDPYFSTKPELQGKGLGLYFAKLLAEKALKGKILVENDKNGAVFYLIISKEL